MAENPKIKTRNLHRFLRTVNAQVVVYCTTKGTVTVGATLALPNGASSWVQAANVMDDEIGEKVEAAWEEITERALAYGEQNGIDFI